MNKLLFTTVYVLLLIFCESAKNNVCKNLEDYDTIKDNPNCWYSSDVGASPQKILSKYGYPFETYKVKTADGYFVTLFRIPNNGTNIKQKRIPIFFQHGVSSDGIGWMTAGLDSIVFFFSNRGYDIWLSNCRGTAYSLEHTRYTVNDKKFWDFSFHEMAVYDIPAMLNFISSKTSQKGQIIYIGHSMGTTISYIYSSLYSDEARGYLKRIISLAPVANLNHVTPIVQLLAKISNTISLLVQVLQVEGTRPLLEIPLKFIKNLCSKSNFVALCSTALSIFIGANEKELVASELPVLLSHFPSGFSRRTLIHYAQVINSQKFQFFDFGPDINLKRYNSVKPPAYPLENIRIPVHLIYGNRDVLSTEEDVFYLYDRLKTEKTIMEAYNFTHLNFIVAKHSLDFYEKLFEYMNKV